MGDANMRHLVAFIESGGRFVSLVSEGAAMSMAHGHARTSGLFGAVSVTHGPAFSNTLTALTDAIRARAPLLVLTSSTPEGHLQDSDVAAGARLAGAEHHRIGEAAARGGDLRALVRRARARRIPIVVDTPVHVQDERLDDPQPGRDDLDHSEEDDFSPEVDEDVLNCVFRVLLSVRRPVVLAGRSAALAGARDALVALADLLSALLAMTRQAKDAFGGHEFDLEIAGTLSHPVASDVLADADCIIAFGASLNDNTLAGRGFVSGKVVDRWVPAIPALAADATEIQVCSDARTFARLLVDRIGADRRAPYGTR